jgi:hypothetical protein
MRLGPDTTNALVDVGYRHFSGYNYLDTQVRAFSHTHFVGAGINDLGNFGIMPVRLDKGNNTVEDMMSLLSNVDRNDHNITISHERVWWSYFNKTNEFASPGQYDVFLDTPRVQASLLATGTHTAEHKYEFLAEESTLPYQPVIILDVCHGAHRSGDSCNVASLSISEDLQSFTATVYFSNKLWVYMYGEFYSTARKGGIKAEKWVTCSNEAGDRNIDCSSDQFEYNSNYGVLFSRVSFGKVVGMSYCYCHNVFILCL